MSEFLILKNGSSYTLCVNGIHNNNDFLYLSFIKPSYKTTDDIIKEFSDSDNVSILKTINEEMTIRVDEGYLYLYGDAQVFEDCVVATHISDTDDVSKSTREVVSLTLSKEKIEMIETTEIGVTTENTDGSISEEVNNGIYHK